MPGFQILGDRQPWLRAELESADPAECERGHLHLVDDRVRRPGLRADEAEVLLVERLRDIKAGYVEVTMLGGMSETDQKDGVPHPAQQDPLLG